MGVGAFGHWLDRQKKRMNLNSAGLAALVGVSQPTVSDWRYGRSKPKPENALALAKVLRVPVMDIYSAMGKIPPDTASNEEARWLQEVYRRLSPERRKALEAIALALQEEERQGLRGDDS